MESGSTKNKEWHRDEYESTPVSQLNTIFLASMEADEVDVELLA